MTQWWSHKCEICERIYSDMRFGGKQRYLCPACRNDVGPVLPAPADIRADQMVRGAMRAGQIQHQRKILRKWKHKKEEEKGGSGKPASK